MSFKSNLSKAAGLGVVVTALTAGAALAATVTTSLNVRTGPGTSFGVIDVLSPGSRVAVVDQQGGWCRVNQPGPNGWVSCRYLTDSRINVAPRSPVYDPRFYSGPSVSFNFGFGPPPRRMMRPWWWW